MGEPCPWRVQDFTVAWTEHAFESGRPPALLTDKDSRCKLISKYCKLIRLILIYSRYSKPSELVGHLSWQD